MRMDWCYLSCPDLTAERDSMAMTIGKKSAGAASPLSTWSVHIWR
jgi:hypothetical protein